MIRLGRRTGISVDTIETVKVARIAKTFRCLPSEVGEQRADYIEAFMLIEEIEAEQANKQE